MSLYSRRLPWSISLNTFTRLVEEKRRAATPVLDLTVSNPTQVLPRYPHSEIARVYASIADLSYRPHPLGSEQARNEIASLYRELGAFLNANQIALTASSSEAYALLFKLLCNPHDEALIPVPSYPLFEYLAALESVRTVPYGLIYDGSWSIDFEDLRNRLSVRSRAIIVVNPNNPTGSFLKPTERELLLQLARTRGIPIISDEVFMGYRFSREPDVPSTLAGQESALVFCLNGLSKMAAMPQMKLGWIAIGGPIKDREAAVARLELLLDTYLSVNTPVQAVLGELLAIGSENRRVLKSRIAANLKTLEATVTNHPVHQLHAEGGWSTILRLPNTQSEEAWITRLLEEKNTIVQPGYFFDMPSEPYIVLSLITPEEIFAEGVSRIARLANESR